MSLFMERLFMDTGDKPEKFLLLAFS